MCKSWSVLADKWQLIIDQLIRVFSHLRGLISWTIFSVLLSRFNLSYIVFCIEIRITAGFVGFNRDLVTKLAKGFQGCWTGTIYKIIHVLAPSSFPPRLRNAESSRSRLIAWSALSRPAIVGQNLVKLFDDLLQPYLLSFKL